MLISAKQHEANCRNAQQSSGPVTPEGKEAVRCNALTYGLRARSTILSTEDPVDFACLWNSFEAEWQPQTRTEWCYLETMVTSQWLLARVAESEWRIHQGMELDEPQLKLLAYVFKQRAQLERSFRAAVTDMRQAQKERQARETQPPQTTQPVPSPDPQPPAKPEPEAKPVPVPTPANPIDPPPAYVMSECAAAHPVVCSPSTADTR